MLLFTVVLLGFLFIHLFPFIIIILILMKATIGIDFSRIEWLTAVGSVAIFFQIVQKATTDFDLIVIANSTDFTLWIHDIRDFIIGKLYSNWLSIIHSFDISL